MGKFFQFDNLKKRGNELGLDPKRWSAYVDPPATNTEKRFTRLNMANWLLDAYESGDIGLDDMLAAAASELPMGRAPTLFELVARASIKIGPKKRSCGRQKMPLSIVRLARFLARDIEKNPSRKMCKAEGKIETLSEAVQRELQELGFGYFVKSIRTLERKLTGIAKRPRKNRFKRNDD
jgi:hypothetical protein